jgi:hypothetical protein
VRGPPRAEYARGPEGRCAQRALNLAVGSDYSALIAFAVTRREIAEQDCRKSLAAVIEFATPEITPDVFTSPIRRTCGSAEF